MLASLAIEWCCDPARAGELARFFAQNIDPDYISHSELQGARALSPNEWRDGLSEILRQEIEPLLATAERSAAEDMSKLVLTAERDGTLAGLSLISFDQDAAVPFATVEDLVVDRASRRVGIGGAILDWIVNEARKRGIQRLFLESGAQNESAHRFFEDNGFHVCSVVMMRSLGETGK